METSNESTFTESQTHALATLQALAPSFNEAQALRDEADATRDGAHDLAVDAAIECGDWETFEPVISELENRIRENIDGEAERWNAKPGKKEGRFVVPNTVSHIKSRLKKAFELGVPMADDDGEPRTFNSIKADVKNTQDVINEADAEAERNERIAEAGTLREYGAALVSAMAELVRDLPEAELAELVTAMEKTVTRFTDSDDGESEAEADVAEALAA